MDSISAESRIALVLSGGVGLGAYQAGAYEVLHAQHASRTDWIAAASVGAANAAVIAGNAPQERVARLRELWRVGTFSAAAVAPQSAGAAAPWRHAQNWMRALQTRVVGAPGHFAPRYLSPLTGSFVSLYDLAPLRERLHKLVDFGRLNSGEMRFSIVTTDVASGESVYFDTAKGDRITVDHLLASAGFLPEFAPIEIDGRLLGDGGLSSNAPIEAILFEDDAAPAERVCFIVDLFARDGSRPKTLEAGFARKNDLIFSNQTYKRLELHQRECALQDRVDELTAATSAPRGAKAAKARLRRNRTRAIFYLSYRAPPEEAGPEKAFDLSSATAQDRWQVGALDMAEALRELAGGTLPERGCSLVPIRRAA